MTLGRHAADDERDDRAAEARDDEPGRLLAPRGPKERVAPPRDQIGREHREGHEEEQRLAEQGPDHRSQTFGVVKRRPWPPASRFIEPDIELAKDSRRHAPDVALAEGDRIVLADHSAPLPRMNLVLRRIEPERT